MKLLKCKHLLSFVKKGLEGRASAQKTKLPSPENRAVGQEFTAGTGSEYQVKN